jgi:hypothetical protein
VPSIYTANFKDLKADGKVRFDGFVKGRKNAISFPSYALSVLIENGMFQYANLPTSATNINLDFKVNNNTDKLENSILNVKKISMNLGKNPINGRVLIEGLGKSKVDADIVAKVDLEQLGQIFPMKGLQMKGLYEVNLKAKGTYDTLAKTFPQVNALMSLSNGFIKSDKFPEPIHDLNLKASLVNQDAALVSTRLDISALSLVLDGEPFTASGVVENFDNYTWDIKAKGKIDLTKITKIYPLKNMTLKGVIDADIETKGKMADVTAKRYYNLPTSGKASMRNVDFVSKDYPQGIKVTTADMIFTPQAVKVNQANGFLGSSDFTANGTFTNYMGYLLNDGTIKGNMSVKSEKFNVNEWMTDIPQSSSTPTNMPLQVVEIPKNIDLTMTSDIKEALYDKMTLKNIKGILTVGNSAVKMQQVTFQSLGGNFTTNGTYNAADLAHPNFDFSLNLENVEMTQAYQQLNIVKYLMPVAQYLIGGVNSKLKIGGELGQDMLPKMNTISGDGLMKILKAEMAENNPLIQKLIETTKLSKLKDSKLSNLLMQFVIKDGTFGVKPFDIKFDDYKITASGRHGLTGSMDYALVLDVPAGKTGEAFSNVFQKWTGKPLQGTDRVKFDLVLGGDIKNPTFGFKGSSTANAIKEVVKAEIQAQVDAVKTKALAEADRLKKEAEAKLQLEKDKLLNQANAKKGEIEAKIQKEREALEQKTKSTVDSIKKAATERAKKLLEEQKKSVLDGLFKKPKPAKKDTTR